MTGVGRQATEASGGLDIGLSDIAFGQTGPYGTEKITQGRLRLLSYARSTPPARQREKNRREPPKQS